MAYPVKPIKDLYFRFIKDTKLDGLINAQDLAWLLNRHGLIDLVPHRTKPLFEHYRAKDALYQATGDTILELVQLSGPGVI